MHDFFDILGVPHDAPAQQIRRACARRTVTLHPDFGVPAGPAAGNASDPARPPADLADVAIDFVDMSSMIERMQAAFFTSAR